MHVDHEDGEGEYEECEGENDDSDFEEPHSASIRRGEENPLGAMREAFCGFTAILLLCVPAAMFVRLAEVEPVVHFCLNFGAIIPLAWMISVCTEHLEQRVGPAIGTLLNTTFGNVVEMILSVQVIRAGLEHPWLFKIVQSSLLGAVLMNLLFVLGACFLLVGMKKRDVRFNMANSIYNLCLLSVASMALVVPTALATFDEFSSVESRLFFSRCIAFCLLGMYVQWLVFNLSTHKGLFEGHGDDVDELGEGKREKIMQRGPSMATEAPLYGEAMDIEEDFPVMPMLMSSLILLICTITVSFHCDFLVESINPVTEELGVNKAFVATVLLPLVGNFSEVIAALSIASKERTPFGRTEGSNNKLDLAMGIAISSASQIAMVVIPFAVLVGWALGAELDLDFEVYQVHLLILCILIASLMLQDGHANWLKGTMLLTSYGIVAASFWFITDREFKSAGDRIPTSLICNITGTTAICTQDGFAV